MPAWIGRFRQFTSHPLQQRYTHHADDTRDYVQPQPTYDPQYYLTYWKGNQLPGMFIHVANPHEQWVAVKDRRVLYTSSPQAAQRTQGSFNYNLSQQNSAQVQAVWSAAWKAKAAQVSGGR